jgi:hypothetical protein
MEKYDRDAHIIDQIHEIRREQIQFNDAVSSALVNRNSHLTRQFLTQQKSDNLLTILASISIMLNTIGLIMLIVLLTR